MSKCQTEDDCLSPMWCRGRDKCQNDKSELASSGCSHIDELYAMFAIARDSFIKTRWPKPKPFLHNPLWHLRSTYKQDLDNALAKYATEWWAKVGYKIIMNRDDGSFVVCENKD